MVLALSDPDHPEHDEVKAWVEEDFDPEAFGLNKANRSLARFR